MKGVILAGGLGTRLLPTTRVVNKHILPVYDKPMICYPLQTLINAGIEDIMVVTGGNDAGDFLRLLGNGSEFGLKDISYTYQEGHGGIAAALVLAENFAEGEKICVILGDNIIQGNIRQAVTDFSHQPNGAKILLKEVPDPERFGVVYGADMVHIQPEELINAFRHSIAEGRFQFSRWDERALREMYPLWMLRYLPNMPACHVAIAQDARGPNNTIVLSEASSLLAIAEGAAVIARGQTDVMIVGGTGSRVHPMSWAFRDNWLHSRRYDHPAEISRPFDVRRDGMVYGEGAAALILESRSFAEARGAKILGHIAGFANVFEACTPGEPFGGHAIRSAIRQSLNNAGIEPRDVGHVNAHGLSTIEIGRAHV